MSAQTLTKVLILEGDPLVLEKIKQILAPDIFETQCFSTRQAALRALKENLFQLVITGSNTDSDDPVEVMKAMVMTSPMSSIIMVTDMSAADVEEKAEGYGILGNIPRSVPKDDVMSLIRTFRKIQASIPQATPRNG